MRISLFNYSLYSHLEIGNFRVWHAPTHAHAFAWEEKNLVVYLSVSPTEPSSPAFHHSEPRRRPPWCFAAPWCERRVVLELACPFLCTHAWPLADTGHPSRAAEAPLRHARARQATASRLLPNRGRRPCLRDWASSCARARPCTGARDWTPQATPASPSSTRCLPPRRTWPQPRRAGRPLQCRALFSPSGPYGPHEPHCGNCCPTAIHPHRWWDFVEPPLSLGQSVEHPWVTSKPMRIFPYAHEPIRALSHVRSGRISCGRPPRAKPHQRPHRAKPQATTPRSGVVACITHHVCCHVGYIRLIAADVAAPSALVAGPQPASS
jgi:hypothetical protein